MGSWVTSTACLDAVKTDRDSFVSVIESWSHGLPAIWPVTNRAVSRNAYIFNIIRSVHCDHNHTHKLINAHRLYNITNCLYIWNLLRVSATYRHPQGDTALSYTRCRDLILWKENFDARCLYACNHIQCKQWHVNEFSLRTCQQHIAYSIHTFLIFIAVIIYF